MHALLKKAFATYNFMLVYLSVEMAWVLVEIPDFAVVAVRQSITYDPLILAAVTTPLGNEARDKSGRADIELQPLIGWR